MSERTFIYPGRFQPVHVGHLATVRSALDVTPLLLVGIVIKPVSFDDPFTFFERLVMFRAALADSGIDALRVLFVPLFGPRILEQAANYLVLPPNRAWFLHSKETERVRLYRSLGEVVREVDIQVTCSGTAIRKALAAGDNCEGPLTRGVVAYLKMIQAAQRLTDLSGRDETS